ncbi:MAG: PilC/PilY family type IV pilus protein [Marinagarivorans sp.]
MKIVTRLFSTFALCLSATAFGDSSAFSSLPPGTQQNTAPPVVMLTMPKDHQLFFKAYSDIEDLDPEIHDGPETTFKPSFSYAGYFDNRLCYEYTNERFEPKEPAKKIEGEGSALFCNTGENKGLWSGNFLNWATMTRMDIIRLSFYGGKRAKTQPTGINGVLLERSHIPGDSHSFAKYYGGDRLPNLTPYPVYDTTLGKCNPNDPVAGPACSLAIKGITLCNTTSNLAKATAGLEDNKLSQNTDNPPLIRVARGNFSLWSSSERVQCKFWDGPDFDGMLWKPNDPLNEATPANSALLDNNALNKLMTKIFGVNNPPLGFYFFHDSPTEEVKSAYTTKYEPKYNYPADTKAKLTQKIKDMKAYVVACNSTLHTPAPGAFNCKNYGDDKKPAWKPVGVLQEKEFADRQVHWGLMSGSFELNKKGGVLRKNVAEISDEINAAGDFIAPSAGGIIPFLDNLRIVNWGYNSAALGNNPSDNLRKSSYIGWGTAGTCGSPTVFDGRLATFDNGQCVSWGNPLSEVLAEAYRYLAGKQTTLYTADDSKYFSDSVVGNSMRSQAWTNNPLAKIPTSDTTLKACSKLQVLALNASSVSYDGNDFGTDLFTSIAQDTDHVGTKEGINGSKAFIGDESGTATADNLTPVCTEKTVSSLSKVRGTCPDAPALEGSYLMAGLAYRANIQKDINPNYGKGIKTSGIYLELGRPIIELPDAKAPMVTLLPACQNQRITDKYLGSCALVDFKILSNQTNTDGTISGSILVIWEDSQQGSDFDQDVTQLIEYTYSGATALIKTRSLSKSTTDNLKLGYIVTGVEGGGQVMPITINPDSADNTVGITYKVKQSATKMLREPLFYAAKWGGFDGEEPGPNAEPDNYLVVRDPAKLTEEIKKLLRGVQPAVFGYSSVGSISTLDDGTGLSVITQFRPKAASDNTHLIEWAGSLRGYFRGKNGYLIEDTNKNGKLETSDLSFALRTETKTEAPETFAYRFTGNPPSNFETASNVVGSKISINNLNNVEPFFNAEARLAQIENYTIQGAYPLKQSTAATAPDEKKQDRTKYRFIFTAIDGNSDQLISGSETASVPFDTATGFPTSGANSKNNNWLHYTKGSSADLVNFIRGKTVPNYRNRRIDFISDFSNDADDIAASTPNDNAEPWLLGDIVNSSPLVVSAPTAGYDTDYGDETYAVFREQYKPRRNVLYVGANDGMLHAFNLGVFDLDKKEFDGKEAPIGAELWGYVPFNLLPHLKWLKETSYAHNFYMDGRVKLYDANIFTPDTDHPNGWGSILVATMRTGGRPYEVPRLDAAGKPLLDAKNNPVTDNLRSAVVVMDVTNPEAAPQLIAEIPLPDNTYTTSNPDIFKFRELDENSTVIKNNWYLVIGSGVTDPTEFTSGNTPQLFVYDLINNKWVDDGKGVTVGSSKGWIGGLNARDWDRDYNDDYLYFGTVEGTPAAPSGRLYRAELHSDGTIDSPTPILENTGQAFAATPFTVVDTKNNYWVFAGTGRYFSDSDNKYKNNANSYYAIKEQRATGSSDTLVNSTINKSTLVNLTGINVRENDKLDTTEAQTPITADTRKALVSLVDQNNGWYFNFGSANARNYTSTILSGNSLVFNTYEPGDECTPFGESKQYRRDFLSGLPSKFVRNSTETKLLPAFRDLGIGAASDPTPGKVPVSGTSLGAIDVEPSVNSVPRGERQSWRELPYSQ